MRKAICGDEFIKALDDYTANLQFAQSMLRRNLLCAGGAYHDSVIQVPNNFPSA